MSKPNCIRERVFLQAFIVISWIVMIALTQFSRVDVDYWSFGGIYFFSGVLYLAAILLWFRKDRYFVIPLEMVASGMALVVPILMSTYLAISLNYPLADPQLMAMDRALGFDWKAFILMVDQSPFISRMLIEAYASFSLQLMCVPVLLAFFGNTKRAVAFIFGYGFLCFISSIISIWFPALGTYTVFDIDPAMLQNINPHFGYHFLTDFNALREGGEFTIQKGGASGILTFPSVHAAIAFYIIWVMWTNKWLRWPFVVLNILMAVSAISHANHYLIDVVAGAGVAAVTAALASYVFLGHRFDLQSVVRTNNSVTAAD
jgi:membrane-associated phospholipid phosphatase